MFLWLVLGCTTTSSSLSLTCDLAAPALSPTEAAVGETVVAITGPLTESWDTTVSVGSTPASGVVVTRQDCDACDECVAAAECNVCLECDECITDCAACVETVSFVVPEVALGATTVTITNLHAASAPVAFTVVEAAADTGTDTGDTGDTAL
ncbi:hypothetical protein LBMAG42_19040 [Deltaproteobacteria bacterium]|nr:hypothetical protein LBMAG42_19040 [Deltaproteobacteria bacterium]